MAAERSPADAHDAILDNQSGEPLQHSIGGYQRADIVRKAWDTRGRIELPIAEIVALYEGGESELALARRYGVSRPTLRDRLVAAGVTPRNPSVAQRVKLARMAPEQRSAQSAAAHAAVRGSSVSWERKCKGAITRQERQTNVSPAELALQCWLAERGIVSIPQFAIGAYNADLGIGSVIVEIFGGGWHAIGRHRHRTPDRYRYIFDQGFNAIIVWVDARRHPLRIAAADYIVAYVEAARRNPPARGEYRVIWGDGQDVTPDRLDLDHIARVPPLG